MIRRAVSTDTEAIVAGYEELLKHEMRYGGCSNWKLDVYPTRAVPEKQIPLGKMYVLEEDGQICASMVLNQVQAPEYAQIPWRYPAEDGEVMVIHTLCVPTSCAGRGYGSRMVAFAIERAQNCGCRVMRLDTFWKNEPAKMLYLKNGFSIAGYVDVLHEGLIPEKLVCLERVL